MITTTESQQRITKFQGMLQEKGLDGALFIFPIDVYYFSGTRQNSTLWIPASGAPFLLVRKSLARAREESPIADIRPFPSSKEFAGLFPEDALKIGFTFDVAPVQQLNFYSKAAAGTGICRYFATQPGNPLGQIAVRAGAASLHAPGSSAVYSAQCRSF